MLGPSLWDVWNSQGQVSDTRVVGPQHHGAAHQGLSWAKVAAKHLSGRDSLVTPVLSSTHGYWWVQVMSQEMVSCIAMEALSILKELHAKGWVHFLGPAMIAGVDPWRL
jgi:hypothetical protein